MFDKIKRKYFFLLYPFEREKGKLLLREALNQEAFVYFTVTEHQVVKRCHAQFYMSIRN